MDLLAKRYASPFVILEAVLLEGGFCDFVIELYKIIDEEKLWDIWLNKLRFDERSFEEWKESLTATASPPEKQTDLKATVTNSMAILNGFTP